MAVAASDISGMVEGCSLLLICTSAMSASVPGACLQRQQDLRTKEGTQGLICYLPSPLSCHG